MAYTKAQLEAIKNSELASAKPIFATNHRTVEQAVFDEMFDAQSRGNLFANLTSLASPLDDDSLFVIRNGVAYKIPASVLDFVQNFSDLSDVVVPTPGDDFIVHYNASTSKWESKALADFSISYNAVSIRTALESLVTPDRLPTTAIEGLDTFISPNVHDLLSIVTTTATIDLPFASKVERTFSGATTILAGKTWTISTSTAALRFTLVFTMNGAYTHTFPVGFQSTDALYNNTTRVWTSLESGKYKVVGTYDGTNWILDFTRVNN